MRSTCVKWKCPQILAFVCAWGIGIPALAADVVVVKSKNMPVYDQTVDGFKGGFQGSVEVMTMSSDDAGELASSVSAKSPRVVVAIGLNAALALKSKLSDVPIVYSVVPVANPLNDGIVYVSPQCPAAVLMSVSE